MDLTFSEDQAAIIELADTILRDTCGPAQLRALEQEVPSNWAADAWRKLAAADLLGLGLAESMGGGGYGFVETALVIERAAQAAAPLPTYATLVLGAMPIAEFGSASQQTRWLPGMIEGSTILTGCLVGAADVLASDQPPVAACVDGDHLVLDGEAWYVPFAAVADAYVVPVDFVDGRGRGLVVVDASAPGIILTALAPMSDEPQSNVRFDAVAVDNDCVLEGATSPDGASISWLCDRALAATCVAQVGNCAGALALTAKYVSEREQFGSKLATFQAVSQRAADAYIDTELVRLTAWHVVWLLAEGRDASESLPIAKFFAGEAAQRVVAAAQHLHGGIGMDLDYPVHRYFRWAKEYELRLGSGAEHLAGLGAALAAAT